MKWASKPAFVLASAAAAAKLVGQVQCSAGRGVFDSRMAGRCASARWPDADVTFSPCQSRLAPQRLHQISMLGLRRPQRRQTRSVRPTAVAFRSPRSMSPYITDERSSDERLELSDYL